jgi:hypothetical protein
MERPDAVTPPAPSPAPPPRAFAQGTGVLLQTIGVTLFLLNCCICSTGFLWDQKPASLEILDQARQQGLSASAMQDPAKLGVMLTVVFSTVGGLAMAACGLGLQSERRRAAWGAFGTVLVLSLILLSGGAALWIGGASLAAKLWNAALTLVALISLGFTWVALRQVIANPPPPDVDVVPPGTKIPYSFYHDDPPDVRLAKELAQRRAKLDAERREIDKMEQDLRDKQE